MQEITPTTTTEIKPFIVLVGDVKHRVSGISSEDAFAQVFANLRTAGGKAQLERGARAELRKGGAFSEDWSMICNETGRMLLHATVTEL